MERIEMDETLINGIPLEEYNKEKPPTHAFHVFMIVLFVIIGVIVAAGLITYISANVNPNEQIKLTGSTGSFNVPEIGSLDNLVPTEEYLNNCSNNWTFVACTRNRSGTQCYADGKPIPITGYVETSENNVTITYWMRRNVNGSIIDELKVFKNVA